jgi:hypothetical protein
MNPAYCIRSTRTCSALLQSTSYAVKHEYAVEYEYNSNLILAYILYGHCGLGVPGAVAFALAPPEPVPVPDFENDVLRLPGLLPNPLGP